MIYLSASSIRDFLKCSKMYYYRTQHPEESVDTEGAIIGKVVHGAVERYWDDEAGAFRYAADKIKEQDVSAKASSKILHCVDSFFGLSGELGLTADDKIEYYFKEKMPEDYMLVGKMDRIIPDRNTVIDWKTGKTRNYLNNDVQFIIYYVMYKKLFGKFPVVLQIDLNSGIVTPFQPTKLYIDTLFNSVIPMILERIRRQQLYKEGYFNGACYGCSFIPICNADQ